MVEQHGMEVFTKYFRRLLVSNAPHVWGSARSSDGTGSYPILVSEMQKVTREVGQSAKIVESVDFGEGEIFKDFDLSTFMDHFKMSPVAKVTLASAFRKASRPDLRTKGKTTHNNNANTAKIFSRCNSLQQHAQLLRRSCRAKHV